MAGAEKKGFKTKLGELQLDQFIDAALFLMFASVLTMGENDNILYKIFFFVFTGLSFLKVVLRLFTDGKVKVPVVFLWYSGFTLLLLISVLWAWYPDRTIAAMSRAIQVLMILFCLPQTYATPNGFRRCAGIFSSTGIVSVFYIFIATPVQDWFSSRLGWAVTGLNVNLLGLILSLCMVLSVYYAYYEKRRIFYLFSFVEFSAIILTGSRRSTIVCIVGCLLLAFLKDRSWRMFIRILALLCLTGIGFFALMNIEPLYNAIGVRFESMLRFLITNSGDGSMFMRRWYADYARQLFSQSPLVGIGTANFASSVLEATGHATYAHNNYYELLANNGIIGLLAYYGFHAYIIIKLLKINRFYSDDTAKAMLTLMVVLLLSDLTIVVYLTVSVIAFVCLPFLFICSFDLQFVNTEIKKNHGRELV